MLYVNLMSAILDFKLHDVSLTVSLEGWFLHEQEGWEIRKTLLTFQLNASVIIREKSGD